MKKMLIVFNGRNAGNIAREAQDKYPEHELFLLQEASDALPAPEGMVAYAPFDLLKLIGLEKGKRPEDIVLIANGGRTRLQVQTVTMLTGADPDRWAESYRGSLRIVDLQPDGEELLFERRPLAWDDKSLKEEFTPEQLNYFGIIQDAAWLAPTLPENWTEYFRR